jgi:hypothetical protein
VVVYRRVADHLGHRLRVRDHHHVRSLSDLDGRGRMVSETIAVI